MTIIYLRTDTEAEMIDALKAEGLYVEDEDGGRYVLSNSDQHELLVIGPIPAWGPIVGGTEEEPIHARPADPRWHVNIYDRAKQMGGKFAGVRRGRPQHVYARFSGIPA